MATVSPSSFRMGEIADDKFANDTERPSHLVALQSPFQLGIFPVTVAEYRRFNPAHPAGEDELPVVSVSWLEALAYCAFLKEETGLPYRLPSEAEWECAARAGSEGAYSWGSQVDLRQANYLYDEQGLRVGLGRRTAPGTYAPNAWGFFDTHGNVCEWVADHWHPTYHGAPGDGSPWPGSPEENRRVLRGGAWDYLPRLLRSSWRDCLAETSRRDNLGFRVACDL